MFSSKLEMTTSDALATSTVDAFYAAILPASACASDVPHIDSAADVVAQLLQSVDSVCPDDGLGGVQGDIEVRGHAGTGTRMHRQLAKSVSTEGAESVWPIDENDPLAEHPQ